MAGCFLLKCFLIFDFSYILWAFQCLLALLENWASHPSSPWKTASHLKLCKKTQVFIIFICLYICDLKHIHAEEYMKMLLDPQNLILVSLISLQIVRFSWSFQHFQHLSRKSSQAEHLQYMRVHSVFLLTTLFYTRSGAFVVHWACHHYRSTKRGSQTYVLQHSLQHRPRYHRDWLPFLLFLQKAVGFWSPLSPSIGPEASD